MADLTLDLWLLRQALIVSLLAERWWLRPWRHRLHEAARELNRRAVEARQLMATLDRIVAAGQEQARTRTNPAEAARAELNNVVERWRHR